MLSKDAQQFLSLIVFITAPLLALAATKADAGESEVSVLYAGSLVNLMEKDMGPTFNQATGYKYLGEGKGSVALANMIKEKLKAFGH
jgi:molybdate/tungstate transport system substrate-binding protein